MKLLVMLAEELNCTYLSDLRFLSQPNALLHRAVADIPLACFSEKEWLDAAHYLCGTKCENAEAARDTLLQF